MGIIKADKQKILETFKTTKGGSENYEEEECFIAGKIDQQNAKYDTAILEVIDPIFDRNNYWAHITDKTFHPPKYNQYDIAGGAFKKVQKSKEALGVEFTKWYDDIATFVHANIISNSLVLCLSNEDAASIGVSLKEKSKGRYEVLYANENESMHAIIGQHKQNVKEGKISVIVGNAQFYTGIDLPGNNLHQTFMSRLPFEPKGFRHGDDNKTIGVFSTASDTTNKMILNFRQGIGRTIRSESDRGLLYVLDGRIHNGIYGKAVGFLQELSVNHDLSYIQEKAKGFLSIAKNTNVKAVEKSRLYCDWYKSLIFGEKEMASLEHYLLDQAELLTYKLKSKNFGSNERAISMIKKANIDKKDMIGAILSAYVYLYYEETSTNILSAIKDDFVEKENFYSIFLNIDEYDGENQAVTNFLKWVYN